MPLYHDAALKKTVRQGYGGLQIVLFLRIAADFPLPPKRIRGPAGARRLALRLFRVVGQFIRNVNTLVNGANTVPDQAWSSRHSSFGY